MTEPAAPPAGVVVHAGFHKTGTTTVQRCLRRNRDRLADRLVIALRADLGRAPGLAALHARRRLMPLRLAYRRALIRALRRLPRADGRVVLISAERLSGLMPGRRGNWSYDAAPALAAETLRALRAVWGEVPVTFFYTTRERDSWLNSAWRFQVRADGMALDLDDFLRRAARVPAPEAVFARVQSRLPGIRTIALPVDTAGGEPLGPAGPLLRAAGVPQPVLDTLLPVEPANVGLDAADATALVSRRRAPA